ncbi:hypothetical protein SLE2022_196750 [Rubroshorea leprosula]
MITHHLLFVFLALSTIPTLADVNIDCGSTSKNVYIDENSLAWVGDDGYIQSGEPQTVPSTIIGLTNVMSTLRVFTTGKKNCYSNIFAGKGSKVMVRASFLYGNYDKKSSPPSFDLQFDGNHWATVVTSSDQVVSYEAIYVTKVDYISVCVAQTSPQQFPFISAIEVGNLNGNMYGLLDVSYALFLKSRVAFGAKDTIRKPDDVYNRIWDPAGSPGQGITVVSSDAFYISGASVDDFPPQAVLQNAFTTAASTTGSIDLTFNNLPQKAISVYANMYFSEVTQLDSTQKRSIQVNIDGISAFSKPIVPVYEEASELRLSNHTASANTTFSLVAAPDSTLPPLINAMEVFSFSDELTDGTYSDDVNGLASLLVNFDVLQAWGGDPCLPAPYSWDWINCTADATPRVTALYLNSFGMSGALPDFSSMTSLETIDLSNNSITELIPDFLGTLPKLKLLNLADNNLAGTVPSSLTNNKNLKLILTGNPDLCLSGDSCQTDGNSDESPTRSSKNRQKRKNKKTPVIIGSSIPSVVVVLAVGWVLAKFYHKRRRPAIAAHAGGARPDGATVTSSLHEMVSDIGPSVMEEVRVSIRDEITSKISEQLSHQEGQQ